MNAESFFSRWQPSPAKSDQEAVAPDAEVCGRDPAPAPLPTESDLAALAPGASVADFMRAGVDEVVKRGALKKLFADPHYNVMDGLDTYIADYGIPDPIPDAMLRGLNQVRSLFLFEHAANRPGAEVVPAQVEVVAAQTDVAVGEGAAESAEGVREALADDDGPELDVEETQTFSRDAESLDAEISPPFRPSPFKGEGATSEWSRAEISPPSQPHCCVRDGLALSGEPQGGSKPRFAPLKGEGVDGVACSDLKGEA